MVNNQQQCCSENFKFFTNLLASSKATSKLSMVTKQSQFWYVCGSCPEAQLLSSDRRRCLPPDLLPRSGLGGLSYYQCGS